MELLQPKTIDITDGNGNAKQYIISKFPAVQGREIVSKYPIANMPKLGDYQVSEETMLKLMNFVAVDIGGGVQNRLSTIALVNNQVSDWEALAKIEMAMMEYNCSFFRDGRISTFLGGFAEKVQGKILEMLTGLSGQSSQTEKQPSTS